MCYFAALGNVLSVDYHELYTCSIQLAFRPSSMESNAVDDQAHFQPAITESVESAYANENGNTASLPSPPSAKAGVSDSGHKENDSHSVKLTRVELSVNGSSTNANGGANAGNTHPDNLVGLQANHWKSQCSEW